MKKIGVKRKRPSTKKSMKSNGKGIYIEKMLVENFVSLQKVMTNLSLKFDNLTNQISKLLNLFEISAKTLAQKEFNLGEGKEENKKVVEKIDKLLDQNKIIARGLTLMHEIQNKKPDQSQERQMQQSMPPQRDISDVNRYQKSIINPGTYQDRRINRFRNINND